MFVNVVQSGKKEGESVHILKLRTEKGEKKKNNPQKMGKCVAHVDIALKGYATKLLSP